MTFFAPNEIEPHISATFFAYTSQTTSECILYMMVMVNTEYYTEFRVDFCRI